MFRHLPLELGIVEPRGFDRLRRKDRVEPVRVFPVENFLDGIAVLRRRDLLHVHQSAKGVRSLVSLGFLREMVENIRSHKPDPFGRHIRTLAVDIENVLVRDLFVLIHRLDVIDAERKHVFVVDRVDDGIGMELIAERLLGRFKIRIFPRSGIDGEDGRSGEPEKIVLLEIAGDRQVHIAELTAVTFVEDKDDPTLIDGMIGILLDKGREFLDRGNDDPVLRSLQLLFQDRGIGIGVGGALLESVVFAHRLVVQILSVNDEKHLVDIGQIPGEPRSLERGQGLSGSGSVPDIPAPADRSVILVVVRHFDTVEDPFGRHDLIGAHHEQTLLRRKNAIARQNIQQRMACKEGTGKVDEIGDRAVLRVRPKRGELKTVSRLSLSGFALSLFDVIVSGGVGVILGIGPVRDHEDLHVFKEPGARPERVAEIAVDLVERLFDRDAPPFQFHVYQRKPVDKDRDVVAIVAASAVFGPHHVLIDDLQAVVMYVLFVQQRDILRRSVVAAKHLHVILLDPARLLNDPVVLRGNTLPEKAFPFRIGERALIQRLDLATQIVQKILFGMDGEIFVSLLRKHAEKIPLEFRFALIGVCTALNGCVLCNDGCFG